MATKCSDHTLDQACRVVWEAALELASSDRFHRLVFALGPKLAKERYMGAETIRRLLEEADGRRPRSVSRHHAEREDTYAAWPPKSPVVTHQRPGGVVDVYSYGRLIASRVSEDEADRQAREILG